MVLCLPDVVIQLAQMHLVATSAALRILNVLIICTLAQPISSQTLAPDQRIMPKHKRTVIAARTVFNGKGSMLRDTRIVIEDSKIVAIVLRPALWITTCVVSPFCLAGLTRMCTSPGASVEMDEMQAREEQRRRPPIRRPAEENEIDSASGTECQQALAPLRSKSEKAAADYRRIEYKLF